MAQPTCGTSSFLDDEKTAGSEIDRCLRFACVNKVPCCVFIPMDIVAAEIDGEPLQSPLNVMPENDVNVEDKLVAAIYNGLKLAQNPVVVVDALASRHNAVLETRTLVAKLKIPVRFARILLY